MLGEVGVGFELFGVWAYGKFVFIGRFSFNSYLFSNLYEVFVGR